jgi:hypothetical protein
MVDTFTGGQLTGIMLLFDPIGPAALQGLLVIFVKLRQQIRSFHLSSLISSGECLSSQRAFTFHYYY